MLITPDPSRFIEVPCGKCQRALYILRELGEQCVYDAICGATTQMRIVRKDEDDVEE